ncbi:MAG: ABC transporter permease [Bacteroidia bacterium]|nr:ABC transporter permease [Bacteroidia bacterium]
MLRNYLLIAIRNLQRQFSYSFINIIGLAIGLACSLVIFMYVYAEWSFDRHFKNGNQIFRIGISFYNMGTFAIGPEVLGNVLPREFEGIQAFTRVKRERALLMGINGKTFTENVYHTDSSYFKVFSYSFVAGNSSTALKGPSRLVLTESMARKYFGDELALGKTLEIGKERESYSITGIVKDDVNSTHLKSNIWLSMEGQLPNETNWTSAGFYNYVLLKEKNTQADLAQALNLILEKQVYPSAGVDQSKVSFEDYRKNENSVKFHVTPLKDIHLKSKLNYELSPGGDETNLYIFSAISVFILTLASVNFINLTTARATRRAKEVGIRKALGTSRVRLIHQFLLESILVTSIALIISLGLAEVFILTFQFITGDQLVISLWTNNFNLMFVIGFSVLVGLLSGVYPAFYLTAFNPIYVLKGSFVGGERSLFRNTLVVFQFSISVGLIICTAIIFEQFRFIQNKDLGFNTENIITVDNMKLLGESAQTFKQELLRQSGVINASIHTGEPGSKSIMSFNAFKAPKMEKELTINTYFGDKDYLNVMGYQLIKGTAFPEGLESDSTSVILNEAAVAALGLGNNPIGEEVNKGVRVIGVVKDFHWESLRNPITPAAIILKSTGYQLAVKMNSNNASEVIKVLTLKWSQIHPEDPIEYHFMDENFGELLRKEQVFGKVIGFFTALAIIISCLGLYGLAAFTAEQRTKEIGIRKVLGATASNIVLMLSKKFTTLVCVAILIAVPASMYVMLQWLEGFAYRTELQVWIFGVAILLALVLAWLTVGYHSLKAATINPAGVLKNE